MQALTGNSVGGELLHELSSRERDDWETRTIQMSLPFFLYQQKEMIAAF